MPPWTAEQLAAVRRGFARGLDDAVVGRAIGRTAAAVAGQRYALGLRRRSGPRAPKRTRCAICGQAARQPRHAYCRACQRDYQRQYQRLRYRYDPDYRQLCNRYVAASRAKRRGRERADRREEQAWRNRLGPVLIDRLLARGWSKRDVTRALSLGTATLWRWRSGRGNITVGPFGRLLALAEREGVIGGKQR